MERNHDRAISPEIETLMKNRKKVVKASEIPVRDQAYADMRKLYAGEPVIIQFAYGFAETLKRKSILIQKEDLLAGFLYQYTYNVNFPMKTSAEFDPAKRASLRMDVEREAAEAMEALKLPEESEAELYEFAQDVKVWLYKHWHSGHTLAGYEKLLQKGFAGLLRDVEEAEKSETGSAGKQETWRAFRIVLCACEGYVERYEKEAERMARGAKDPGVRRRMLRMRRALKRIKTEPPENFFEALQLLYLAHEMMYCENVPSAVSVGRLDVYLEPFYEKDRSEGKLTYEQAGDLIDAFFVKCASQMKAYQNLTLGGCKADGGSVVNDITYLCLEASGRLRLDQPSLSFRWTEDMPEETWRAVLKLIRMGMGFPALFYDPCCMAAGKYRDILKQDLWRYAFIGCVEPAIPGKEYALTEMARLNLPKLLQIFLFGGEDPVTGVTLRVKNKINPDKIQTFEQFYELLMQEIDARIAHIVFCADCLERMYERNYPLPYLSVLTDDCIGRGKDVTEGGAEYYSVGVNLGGMATFVDSLTVIRQVVYEKKMVSLRVFSDYLRGDFSGAQELRQYIANSCPRFGNDHGEPEAFMKKLLTHIEAELSKYRTYHGGRYRLGLYTVEDHAIMGEITGATPDGRSAGTALSNSMGASQGKDKSGPTALVNSVTCFPMKYAGNGMVLDLRLTPALLETDAGQNALRSLIRTYFRKGGMEIQISVVSGKTLLEAQKHPESYEDLIVRVSGFSAYFCTLRRATQDEIIRRTEYGKESDGFAERPE